MKKYNYIIVSLLACLLTTSCNDYFDQVPDDRLSLKEIFTTRDGALRYLSNVYTFLPDEFNQRQVHETSLYRTPGPWTGSSDEAEWTNDNKGKLINNNSIDATEGTMVLYRWKSWFSGIHEAAVFTENVDQAPLTVTERNQWKAEARALRAIYYFYLVRTYGPVPLLEKDFPMDTPSDELQLPRNTVDECFDFIVSELRGAQNDGLLDDASTDKVSGYGRIDKAIAQAFIIEALTYRASWLFNGECNFYSDLANTDGTKLFPNKPDEATKRANWQKVIDECNTFFSNYGKKCVVLGRSNIVGKPMAALMMQKAYPGDATVTVCHSRSRDLVKECQEADIIIAALGQPNFVKAEMVKEGAVVIDVGTTRVPDATKKSGFKLTGDVKFDEVAPKCSFITPVPGGVGPMTIVSLMKNTLLAGKKAIYQ